MEAKLPMRCFPTVHSSAITSQADDDLTTHKPLSSRFSQARAIVSEDTTIGHVRRRPAVVLFASYNRLKPGDEADSFVGLSLLRTEIIEPQIHKFGGRMIRWTGDEVLLEFESAVEAVRCAVALGEAVSNSNDSLHPTRGLLSASG
jgi:class 3 adenylate cyclase